MRLSTLLLASAILSAVAFSGFSGCGFHQDNNGTVASIPATDLPGLQSVGLHQVWQRQVKLEPGERIKASWRLGQSVWITTTESRIVRIDATTGVLKWSNGLGRENFQIYKPIELKGADGVAIGQVLVVSRGDAFVFDMETGDELRRGSLGMSVSADPVVIGNTLCVGGADTFYGLYLDRLGMKHWRIPAPGDLFMSAPQAMDNNVLVGSKNGLLWRIGADNGDWDWKDRKTNGAIVGGLGVDYSAVYVPCEDQRVYAFRTDTGSEIWEQQLDGRLEETPVLAGPVVMVTAVNRTMFALDRQTGAIKWKLPDVAQVATVTDESVWIGDTGGIIRHISLETGQEKESALTAGIQVFVRNNVDQRVVLVTEAGLVGMYSPAIVNGKP